MALNHTAAALYDTAHAELLGQLEDTHRSVDAAYNAAHRIAGDRKTWVGRTQRWGMFDTAAIDATRVSAADGDLQAREVIEALDERIARRNGLLARIKVSNEIYRADPWQRFILCLSADGHIHATTACSTLRVTSQCVWLTSLSGLTVAAAVAAHDEGLCSVCFSSAPVAWQEPRVRVDPAKVAAKNERAAKLAAKNLTDDEIFCAGSDRIETVSACERVIREAIDQAVEVEWYATDAARKNWTGSPEHFEQVRANVSRSLAEKQASARHATRVLIDREADHAGHGRTAEAIAKIEASKAKSSRKAWFQ